MKEGRSRIWVNHFQSKLFIRIVTYWFIFMVCLWNFLFLWRYLAGAENDAWSEYTRFYYDFYPMILCFALIVPFLAWDAVRFSHRLVGPLIRIENAIQSVSLGEPIEPVKLRTDDFLVELKDELNMMLAVLQQKGVIIVTAPIPAPRSSPQPVAINTISERA